MVYNFRERVLHFFCGARVHQKSKQGTRKTMHRNFLFFQPSLSNKNEDWKTKETKLSSKSHRKTGPTIFKHEFPTVVCSVAPHILLYIGMFVIIYA